MRGEQQTQLERLLIAGLHHMAIVKHAYWIRYVHTSWKTKGSHKTLTSMNQPISKLPRSRLKHLCGFVFLKANVGNNRREKNCANKRKNTYQKVKEVADTRVTCFLSAHFLIPLSLPWGTCTLSWRGHIWLLSTGKKKSCFLFCLISAVLFLRREEEVQEGILCYASQRSKIKAERVKLKTLIL